MVNIFQELISSTELGKIEDPEERFTTNGVNWDLYETLLNKLIDNSHYRLTYLDGVLEIVSPSFRHEKLKKRLAILLEFYLLKQRIKHTPMGSPTLKNQLQQAGAEPDECYCIGEETEIPNLVIEVIITSGSIDKLATYQRLGVAEVWFWQTNHLQIYHLHLENHGYEQIKFSALLPNLNIVLLEECVLISDQIEAINEFERRI